VKAAVAVPKPRFVTPSREHVSEGNGHHQTMAEETNFFKLVLTYVLNIGSR
jgi:hypothetical protein